MMAEKTYIAPSRVGLVGVTFYMSPERRQALKLMAVQEGTTLNEILDEAVEREAKRRQAMGKGRK